MRVIILPSLTIALYCATASVTGAAAASPLAAAGYSVLPAPQRVNLTGKPFRIDSWRIVLDPGVAGSDVAVEALKQGLTERNGIKLEVGADAGPVIHLAIRPVAVQVGAAQDREKEALAEQAYRIELSEREIRVTANAAPGLFYGVETLVQLVTRREGTAAGCWLPAAEITDWPDLQLRQLYWDDAHHLERMDALKQAIRQAAFFKINAFVLKLEGHFQYASAPALVEPQALSPGQLQELTDFGLRYHVQLIPYFDAPAHVAFILKHPDYAALRAFPDSNYEFCTTNQKTYDLLFGLYNDLLDANKGVKYFYLSTDEPYYVGKSDSASCNEAARQKELGSPGNVLAEFITKAAEYLHDRGRTVIFWGEYPLKPADVPALPAYLVNGETVDPKFDAAFKAHGIRQMFYTSTQGEEPLFPDYAILPAAQRIHAIEDGKPRVAGAVETIRSAATRSNADLMGMMVAGWADAGLHPETFWLGYTTIGAAGWNPRDCDPDETAAAFYRLFYGRSAQEMNRVYELMSHQAQSWSDTWETIHSNWRKPIWGNSAEIFHPGHPARDQSIPLPPAPSGQTLAAGTGWDRDNARRMQIVSQSLADNDQLLELLNRNARQVQFNRYNLEVFISIAHLCRQNLLMLQEIARINQLIATAHQHAAQGKAQEAVAALDQSLGIVRQMIRERNAVLKAVTNTWYQSWLPRVAEANGRRLLHELDDVKDHLPDRTIGMEYLVYRELHLPVGEWVERLQSARNAYAAANHLPLSSDLPAWNRLDD